MVSVHTLNKFNEMRMKHFKSHTHIHIHTYTGMDLFIIMKRSAEKMNEKQKNVLLVASFCNKSTVDFITWLAIYHVNLTRTYDRSLSPVGRFLFFMCIFFCSISTKYFAIDDELEIERERNE